MAKDYILKYRMFVDINYAKKCIVKELKLNHDIWDPYIKSMFYFLTDDQENGKKYYKRFLDEAFFKSIIDEYNYPKDVTKINKDYIINMISERRKFWHSQSSMGKMKIFENYER